MKKKIILKSLSFLMAMIFVFSFCLPVGADFDLASEVETNAESSGTELSREAKDEIQLNLELGELVFEVESLR